MNAGTEARRDTGEGVREHPPDADRRVGEACRAGEEVGRADVGPHRCGRHRSAAGPREGEDHQQEPERRDHLGEQMGLRGAVLVRDADRRQREHPVGDDGTRDAAEHLGGYVGERVAPAQAAEARVDQGDHRVEMTARHRREHQDDREQARCRGHRVLEQLEARVPRRELLGGDPGSDHDRRQESRAEELGEQASGEGGGQARALSSTRVIRTVTRSGCRLGSGSHSGSAGRSADPFRKDPRDPNPRSACRGRSGRRRRTPS